MERDMTTGRPGRILLNFTIPVFIGNVFQQFYSMVDTVIVGKFVGTKALAGVGATGTISFLIIGFLMGMTTGFTVLTSQRFGAGDMRGMRKTVGSAAILSVIVSVIMTIISMAGMRSLLNLLNTPDDIFADAYSYIMIICAGIFAQVLYNLLSSILRALGNSKTPLYFLILSALLNIALDLLLIIVFHLGAAGAAYATVISQGISGLLCLVYIWKKVPALKLTRDDWRFDWHVAKIQMKIGFPMAFQYSITALGSMMVQWALNLLGSTAVAAFTAASKIEQIVTQAYVALGTAIATYAAQNVGAGKVKRIRQGFNAGLLMGCAYAVVTGLFIAAFGKNLTPLFISEGLEEVMGYVDIYLKCVSAFFIPLVCVNLYRNGIQGLGYGLLPMTAGIAEMVGRGVTAVIAAGMHSYAGACMASPMAWVLAGSLLIGMYFYVMRQQDRRFGTSTGSTQETMARITRRLPKFAGKK
ncbi:MAG: MATE family efflux transporter [Eubacteriales bacterium]|nr:MATE family efflux transporter [Eubacteriales bacterium]